MPVSFKHPSMMNIVLNSKTQSECQFHHKVKYASLNDVPVPNQRYIPYCLPCLLALTTGYLFNVVIAPK